MFRSVAKTAAGVVLGLLAIAAQPNPAYAAPIKVQIAGAGSTWSQPALRAWIGNVTQFGLKVSYADTGSTDGRKQFANGKVDFGISEIPYGMPDSATRDIDSPPTGRGYAYMPIVAGGTSFMYNLTIGGKRVTNLRLAGDTIAKIFTNKITFWDDPQIKRDNPKLPLPNRKIIPVVRSDGSGTSAQFTLWLSKQHQDVWGEFCRSVGRNQSPCGLTSYFPVISGKNIGQSGSNGVSGYVAQPRYEGAITYVEYSYAKTAKFPVVKVLNKKGYFVEPTDTAVAVAMTHATINADLTQNLDNVYTNEDKRTYPLSSYSYMVLPTDLRMQMNENKGFTLAEFAHYFLCKGQAQVDDLGYSPLPRNLVDAAAAQVARIPGSAASPWDVTKCQNPTFGPNGENALATTAPYPPECDNVQSGDQCTTGTGGAGPTTVGGGGGSGGGGTGGTATTGPSASASASAAVVVDPDTGETLDAARAAGGNDVAGVPVSLDQAGTWGLRRALMIVAGALLIGLIFGPPMLSRSLGGRRDRDGGRR
ncbi:phosphate ABC transporter substrate-binding protein PstS [Dactylosporangium maewongense]|uniref:Phosphate ABC transporter substrate-binding protein PstS n=1 Tax=Dactylosporangium maewongense TaxID=634393 RepID=A0ABP4LPQ8_9ACTN